MADRLIPNADGTAYPFFIICTLSKRGAITFLEGVWFNRERAEQYLAARRYAYPKNAVVYCASGHHSEHYRTLCETGEVPRA